MKRIGKVLLLAFGVFVVGSIALVVWGERRRYDAPYPDVHASTDPAVIARGSYLVNGPLHCSACHGDPDAHGDRAAPLSGGLEYPLPLGTVVVPNITPDRETGIGTRTDGELARVLRYSVHADGHVVLPFMRVQQTSDEDLSAILSYLRSLPPVRHVVSPHRLNPIGHAVRGLVMQPIGPTTTPPARIEPAVTPEYGRYLVQLGSCATCHTKIDLVTGRATGALLAGGSPMEEHGPARRMFVPPNLTPAKTGRITNWEEDAFVSRFQLGVGAAGSPMPWAWFATMSKDDLRAVFRYLRTLPPVESEPAATPTVVSQREGEGE